MNWVVFIMYITKIAYTKIIRGVAHIPYETGGIIGESNGIVSYVELDVGMEQRGMSKCYYSPNTRKMNMCISVWQKRNINFCGIFHSHLGNNETLSEGDLRYIRTIMGVMPKQIKKLYFPLIVLPRTEMKLFAAVRYGQEIDIIGDSYRIV